MLLKSDATFKNATVEENVFRAERFRSAKTCPNFDVRDLLDEFGLLRRLHEISGGLPYGRQKMLGLIMALVVRPRFLLLDEPVAGLERSERAQVDRFVEHARTALDCGVLIVEHDMDLVRRLCPHLIVLEAGRLLAEGVPDEVLARRDVMDAYLGSSEADACVRALQGIGTTILLAEQMARPALKLVDRAYILRNGEMRRTGSVAEMRDLALAEDYL